MMTDASTKMLLDWLRDIAEDATPGPWKWCGHDNDTVELRGPGHFGALDARLISACGLDPCFAEILESDEDLDDYMPNTVLGPTIHICDPCKEVWRRYQSGDRDAFDRYRCPKPDNTPTVWVNEPGYGHIVPINRFVKRQHSHRPDIEPGVVDHPNALFIQTFNPQTVMMLLDRIAELETIHDRTRRKPSLQNDLDELERTNPDVAAAADAWDQFRRRFVEQYGS